MGAAAAVTAVVTVGTVETVGTVWTVLTVVVAVVTALMTKLSVATETCVTALTTTLSAAAVTAETATFSFVRTVLDVCTGVPEAEVLEIPAINAIMATPTLLINVLLNPEVQFFELRKFSSENTDF